MLSDAGEDVARPGATSLLGFKTAGTGAQHFQYIAPHSVPSSSSAVRDVSLQISLLVRSVMIVGSRSLRHYLGLMTALLIPA